MTERVSTQVEAADMGFLQRPHGVTQGDVLRLDGAWGKKQVWCPMFEPEVVWE